MMTSSRTPYRDLRHLELEFRIGRFTGTFLGWGVFEPIWWRNYLHTHSFYEVCFAYQGGGTFETDGQIHHITQGDLFVARPNVVHQIIADEVDPLGIYFWSFTLQPRQTHTDISLMSLFNEFINSGRLIYPAPHLEPTLKLITAELTQLKIGFEPAIQGLFHKLIIDTARTLSAQSQKNQPPHAALFDAQTALVHRVIRFLQDNYSRHLRLRDVAAQVHLSERHVNRLFKQATGRSVMAALTDIRLEQAKQLLLNPQLTISEVATAVGYENPRNFATLFRKHTNLTPTAYREHGGTKHLKGQNVID